MIEVINIYKKFNNTTVLKNISFTANRGEILGFLGPNGAGKTTTMRVICGFLTADSGRVKIDNLDIENNKLELQKQIGYLPEGSPLYSDMQVKSFLNFIAEIRCTKQEKQKALNRVIKQTSLELVLNKKIGELSKGFKRRVGLAQAIIHNPSIIILDEPTDGLDPNQKHQVRKLIKNLAKSKTIIISTHILEEITQLCSKIVLINQGQIVAENTIDSFLNRSEFKDYIEIVNSYNLSDTAELVRQKLVDCKLCKKIIIEQDKILILPYKDKSLTAKELINILVNLNLKIKTINLQPTKLEQIFRTLTQ